jgi:hypothetical protein
MSQVVSFAEESCWDGETFRSIRREVVFVIAGHAIRTGRMIRAEFRADYGVFWDGEDEWLIQLLAEAVPDIDWGWFVYHKRMDQSGIYIVNPDTGQTVGSIYPRGRTKQKLSGENCAANVVPIAYGHTARANRLAKEAKRDRRNKREEGSVTDRPDVGEVPREPQEE